MRCCWKGGRFFKGKNDENPSHPRSPRTPDLLCPQGTEPCHGMARVCSKLHPSAQAKALWCKIAPSPSEGEFNFTSPWRIALIRNFLGTTRSAELQLLALDSRHFYEILVPGLVVWHGKHIIHTQNNCIKITLGIWLKLTKPRKLRIKAESMSLTHPLRARWPPGRWVGPTASSWAILPLLFQGGNRLHHPWEQQSHLVPWSPHPLRQVLGLTCNATFFLSIST